ncbi:MAG: TonB-dependent receptor [Gammaproteobacteria bacterium]|nr:TonB-dependent receptor [Gammaproteobacteria bacterium]
MKKYNKSKMRRELAQAARRRSPAALATTATGCAILLLSGAEPGFAQDASATNQQTSTTPQPAKNSKSKSSGELQAIVVTGIRRSIQQAITIKRDSDLIVEAVSSEEIGKLPDLSIADSIARLPGIAAQRDQYGNATQISIRGMGPDFVGTTLNGRQQTSTSDTRSVDYASYPSELVSGVVVYKTADASLVGQGLAGTVDVRTVKPLDYDQAKVALNVRKEKLGEGLPTTGNGDRYSASLIDQFFDHTLGIAVGFARLDDNGGTVDDSGTWGGGTMQYNGQTVNVPYGGLNENSDKAHQRRDGIMGVLQYKPNDNISTEVDMFYSKFTTEDQLWNFQMDLVNPHTTNYPNPNGTTTTVIRQPQPVLTNAVLSGNNVLSGTISGIRPVIQNVAIGSNQLLRSLGWNTKVRATDNLTLDFDVNLNDAHNQQYDIETYASTPTVVGGVPNTTSITFNSNNLQLGSSLDFSNRQNTNFTDVLGWSCCAQEQPGYIKYPLTIDKMGELRAGGTLDLPNSAWFKDFRFGYDFSDRHKDNSTDEGYLWVKGTNGALYQNGAHIPGTGLSLAGESGLMIPTYDVFNQWTQYFDIGSRVTPNILAKTWSVREVLQTAYGQFDVRSHLGDIPLRGNAGLQIVRADQSSTAFATSQTSSGQDVLSGSPQQVTRSFSDTEFLPSVNLIAKFVDSQDLRFSVGREMARPNMADMNASTAISVGSATIGGNVGQNILIASGGNPDLKPFLADAVDLSYEKYFGTEGYFSVAGFYKHLESFIVTTTNGSFNFAGIVSPTITTNVSSLVGEYTTTVNGSGGYIDGVEVAATVPFGMFTDWLEGFGMQGSFSLTNSSIVAPNTIAGSGNMTLPGLSKDVANLQIYYQRFGFEARVAERYRSQFIGSLITNFGVPGATYIKSEAPLDAQLSYTIQSGPAKGLQLQLQGQNLKNTPFRTYTSTTGGVTSRYFGRTYFFGLNYSF